MRAKSPNHVFAERARHSSIAVGGIRSAETLLSRCVQLSRDRAFDLFSQHAILGGKDPFDLKHTLRSAALQNLRLSRRKMKLRLECLSKESPESCVISLDKSPFSKIILHSDCCSLRPPMELRRRFLGLNVALYHALALDTTLVS